MSVPLDSTEDRRNSLAPCGREINKRQPRIHIKRNANPFLPQGFAPKNPFNPKNIAKSQKFNLSCGYEADEDEDLNNSNSNSRKIVRKT